MKKIILDSYYSDDCFTVGAIFNDWGDSVDDIEKIVTSNTAIESDYIPGKFYLRELPGIIKTLDSIDLNEIDTIIIDGYVTLINNDNQIIRGLGYKLYETINKEYPNINIVGIAKSLFGKSDKIARKIIRGQSKKPLWITGIGKTINLDTLEYNISHMSGCFRIPDLVKFVDRETKK